MQLDLFSARDRHGWTTHCPGCGKPPARDIWHRWADRTIWDWACIDRAAPAERGGQLG